MALLHGDVTEKILGAAMAVLNDLRPGLDEHFYEQALLIELDLLGMASDRQRNYEVTYKGHNLGRLIPDLIVEQKVVVECKVATAITESHIAQILGYLNITGLQVGLILNFKNKTLTWKRVVLESPGQQGA